MVQAGKKAELVQRIAGWKRRWEGPWGVHDRTELEFVQADDDLWRQAKAEAEETDEKGKADGDFIGVDADGRARVFTGDL